MICLSLKLIYLVNKTVLINLYFPFIGHDISAIHKNNHKHKKYLLLKT